MIYLHIPFCKQKCSYCNFHFSTSFNRKEDMLASIKKEIFLRKDELQTPVLQSVYFGGGTPSVLSSKELNNLIDELLKYYTFDDTIEITLEANPDDLDQNYLKEISKSPINRLSIGIQSFFDKDLLLMNRAHNTTEAESSIKRAQDVGLENLSIDLIYGSPTSNFEIWKQNLEKTIQLQVPHVSSYALTVEPKTALENWISNGKVESPKETEQNEEFHYMSHFLKEQGFDHYEISNFGKPGFHSKHNTAYWKYEPYLGIGPSAHSYDGHRKRSWNIANNSLYIKELMQNKLPAESELLSDNNQFNEMIMIGLRTIWGVNLDKLEGQFPEEMMEKFQSSIQEKLQSKHLIIENRHLKTPKEFWFLADGIASDLFQL